MANLNGKWALVTGASSGLGVDFATILAEKGCNLVITARREDQLNSVADTLQSDHGIKVAVIPLDLAERDAPQVLYDQIKAKNIDIEVLINNAGFGLYGHFVDESWERDRQLLDLDIISLVHLTKLYVKDMVARNSGYILNISSIGAYQPTPTYASYSAAKTYVLYFTEALNYELKDTNVKVTALSPGITRTEFLKVSGQSATLYQRLSMMDSRPVCEAGIKAMLKGKPSHIPGFTNSLGAFMTRFMPRRMQAMVANITMTTG